MTSPHRKIHAIAMVSGMLVLGGCSPPRPDPDLLGNATRVLEQARQSDAQTYAPLELRFATERFEQAQSAMTRQDYPAATRLARESMANSELASVKAKLGRTREAVDRLKIQNEELRRDLDTTVEEGR